MSPFQERVGTAVLGDAAIQHQRAVVGVRQVLLRPAHPRRGQRPLLPTGAALQGASAETGGHEPQIRGQGGVIIKDVIVCGNLRLLNDET